MKQLFWTVKSLCAAVATLTSNIKHMMETVCQSNAKPVKEVLRVKYPLLRAGSLR